MCTPINVPQSSYSVCAPYDIAVDAYNPLVTYPTVYKTVDQVSLSDTKLSSKAIIIVS